MKIMISQPMKGKTNEQIREERAELVKELQKEGHEVIDTVFENAPADEDIAIYVSAGGSRQGTKAVIDGTSTFGMVARSVKDEEKKAIKDE